MFQWGTDFCPVCRSQAVLRGISPRNIYMSAIWHPCIYIVGHTKSWQRWCRKRKKKSDKKITHWIDWRQRSLTGWVLKEFFVCLVSLNLVSWDCLTDYYLLYLLRVPAACLYCFLSTSENSEPRVEEEFYSPIRWHHGSHRRLAVLPTTVCDNDTSRSVDIVWCRLWDISLCASFIC